MCFVNFSIKSNILSLKNAPSEKEWNIIKEEVSVVSVVSVIKYKPNQKITLNPRHSVFVNLQLIKNKYNREIIIGQIASAQSYCLSKQIPLIIHPKYMKISNSGIILYGVSEQHPDDRFLPPEFPCCEYRAISWGIGCILYKMIKGKPLVPIGFKKFQCIEKYLGVPTITECELLKLPYSLTLKKRTRKHNHLSSKESNILKKCLSWNPNSYMICIDKGLAYKVETIHETIYETE